MINHLKLRLKEGKRIQTWPQMVESSALELGTLPIARNDRFFVMGSCFVNEIRHFLEKDGVEVYPKLKSDIREMFPDVLKVKAAWGDWDERVHYQNYTPFSIDQEIDVALGDYELKDDAVIKVGLDYWDPYRKDVRTPSAEQTLAIRRRMSDAIRDGLEQADVAIITAGAIESFMVKGFGGEIPEFRGVLHKHVDFVEHTVEETEACLTRICDKLLNRYGFREVILTVSPIPMGRTHRQVEVALANTYSKAVLRVCVEQVIRKMEHVHYFPSYEFVTIKGGYRTSDYIHIRSEVVGEITSAFQTSFSGPAIIASIDHSKIVSAPLPAPSFAKQPDDSFSAEIVAIDHSRIASSPLTKAPETIEQIDHSTILSPPLPLTFQMKPVHIAAIDHSKVVSLPLPQSGPEVRAPITPIDHSRILSAPRVQPVATEISAYEVRTAPTQQRTVANREVEAQTSSVADLVARGNAAFSGGIWMEAIQSFEAASRLEPRNSRHLRAVAEAQYKAGDSASALSTLARVLLLASDNKKVSRNVMRRITEMARPRWVNLIRGTRPFPIV